MRERSILKKGIAVAAAICMLTAAALPAAAGEQGAVAAEESEQEAAVNEEIAGESEQEMAVNEETAGESEQEEVADEIIVDRKSEQEGAADEIIVDGESGQESVTIEESSDDVNVASEMSADTPEAAAAQDGIITQVSLGEVHSAAIKEDGSLWTWGWNGNGQLGDGTTDDKHTPVKVMDGVVRVQMSHLRSHSAAIKEDGSLWMWGWNGSGQLGDGTTDDKHTPVKVMDGVMQVSLGELHSAAIKEDGSLWMWGYNHYGELGDGTTDDKHTPVKVMDGVIQVSLGGSHSAAIKEDGSLWMWGENYQGELGDGTTDDKYTPEKVMDGVIQVSLGKNYSAAIKEDGSLWMWGLNYLGELGDGTTDDKYAPQKVMDGVVQVGLGWGHSAAIKEDGSLWMWGYNDDGQLGDGTTDTKYIPEKVMDGVVQVSLGGNHSAAIKEDGSLWMWGYNRYGQLGDGTTEYKYVPTQVIIDEPNIPDDTKYEIDYETDLKKFMINEGTINAIQYLCVDSHFPNSVFVYVNDSSFAADVSMTLTNLYFRGLDGWKELFLNRATSEEEAKKILAALLEVYDSDVKELSMAKTADKYAKIFVSGLNNYLKEEAIQSSLDNTDIKKLSSIMTEKFVAKSLVKGEYGALSKNLQDAGGFSKDSDIVKTFEKFQSSKALAKSLSNGLEFLGTGLNLLNVTQDTFNLVFQMEYLLEADNLYSEMLLYLKNNCSYSPVRNAAAELYDVIHGEEAQQIKYVLTPIINSAVETGVDSALNYAVKALPYVQIVKTAYDFGVNLSNLLMHTKDTQQLKDNMRIVAYIGNSLKSWTIENQAKFLQNYNNSSANSYARDLYYSMYMLWNTRKVGEINLQKMDATLLMPKLSRIYDLSLQTSATLDALKESIFSDDMKKEIMSVSVSCPVDVEVYDADGRLTAAVKDGVESSGWTDDVYYCASHQQLDDDYVKVICFPKDGDYSLKYIGTDIGTVDSYIFNVAEEPDEKYFDNVVVGEQTIISLDDLSSNNPAYTVTNEPEGQKTSGRYQSGTDEYQPVTKLSLSAQKKTLEIGEKEQLVAAIAPENASDQRVLWESSDKSVASINSEGVVTPLKAGETIIRCTANENDNIFDEIKITVEKDRQVGDSLPTVELSKKKYIYDGKAKKPSLKVTSKDGKKISSKNYEVNYAKGRKKVGQYTVTVKFKGKYSGTVKKTFQIVPKGTSLKKLKAGKKKLTATWKKQTAQTSGYQLQYATSSKFKSAKTKKVSGSKKTSATLSKLKAKKKYYVRIRTYKTVKVNGKNKKLYSAWSKVKKAKTIA